MNQIKKAYAWGFLINCYLIFLIFLNVKYLMLTFLQINLKVDFSDSSRLKISLIIPVYNKASYLSRSLSSLNKMKQSFIEFICVDDHSSDNSLAILLKFAENNSNFRIVHHYSNKGTAEARFSGIHNARSNYIMFLDPDDQLIAEKIKDLYLEALKTKADVLVFRADSYWIPKSKSSSITSTRKFIKNLTPCIKSFYSNYEVYPTVIKQEYAIALWFKIYKKDILIKAMNLSFWFFHGKKLTKGQDLLFNCFIYRFVSRYICTHIPAYIYFQNLKNNSDSNIYHSLEQRQMNLHYVNSVCSFLSTYLLSNTTISSYHLFQQFYKSFPNSSYYYNQIPNITSNFPGNSSFCKSSNVHISVYNYKDFCVFSIK